MGVVYPGYKGWAATSDFSKSTHEFLLTYVRVLVRVRVRVHVRVHVRVSTRKKQGYG